MIDDRNLDALLLKPLTEVPDRGFSARLIDRIAERESWLDAAMFWAPLAVAAVAVPFVPVRDVTDAILHLSPGVAGSGAVAFAAAVLALTLSLDNALRERARDE